MRKYTLPVARHPSKRTFVQSCSAARRFIAPCLHAFPLDWIGLGFFSWTLPSFSSQCQGEKQVDGQRLCCLTPIQPNCRCTPTVTTLVPITAPFNTTSATRAFELNTRAFKGGHQQSWRTLTASHSLPAAFKTVLGIAIQNLLLRLRSLP